jgi:hypothetical protein
LAPQFLWHTFTCQHNSNVRGHGWSGGVRPFFGDNKSSFRGGSKRETCGCTTWYLGRRAYGRARLVGGGGGDIRWEWEVYRSSAGK